ncbi:MAG: hypothetical protein K9M80_07670 [Candidatus Marinimicrobia bacterium]|nr:hypothetical protein [Candidatus Neomarinimicrobiota bacterium]
MKVRFKYRNKKYQITANENSYVLTLLQKNEDDEEYEARKKYFNNLESVFDILLRDTLKSSQVTTLKRLRKEICKFKIWAKKNFSIFAENLND